MTEPANQSELSVYYRSDGIELLLGDSLEILPQLEDGSFDLVFADPPYFLSNNGISCHAGKMVSVNKGAWDKGLSVEDKHSFNRKWIKECYRLLDLNGTIWISGTLHNIYSIGMTLEEEGFKILNNVTWQKKNPPPNLGCRCFTHSTETILWAKKDLKKAKHLFHYEDMKALNEGKQMKDVWIGNLTPRSEKTEGKHPTQKPEYLLERILLASTDEDSKVLDPFVGSGTTAVVAKKLSRHCVGIDNEQEYLELAVKRLERVDND